MYVIVVYDVPAKRTRIYRKLLRRRLEHLQYSVFFGKLTPGQVIAMKNEIEGELEADDEIVVFEASNSAAFEFSTYGGDDEPASRFT